MPQIRLTHKANQRIEVLSSTTCFSQILPFRTLFQLSLRINQNNLFQIGTFFRRKILRQFIYAMIATSSFQFLTKLSFFHCRSKFRNEPFRIGMPKKRINENNRKKTVFQILHQYAQIMISMEPYRRDQLWLCRLPIVEGSTRLKGSANLSVE